MIELLVVIAIIGILSSVVLASLNTARSKGTDAKIQSELRSIGVNSELYYDSNGNNYGANTTDCSASMFASASIAQIMTDLNSVHPTYAPICRAGGGTASASTYYFVAHQLTTPSSTTFFCVDSTGKATTTVTSITTSSTGCP